MTTYEQDVAILRALPRRHLALFATGCVVRAAPLVDAHGTAITRQRLTEAVDALWAGLGELDDAEADRHQLAYDQAPENTPDVEDAGDSRYWVMEVLQMLSDALVAAQSDGRDIAPSVAAGSLNCFGNVDGVLEDPEHRARRQERAETEAREECLRILDADLPLVEQAARIRALSEQRARELPVPTLEQIRYTPPPD